MTVRVAQQIGMKKVVDVAKEFGVVDKMGAYLPMALGAGETTLLRMTMAYAMLANGALEITPSPGRPRAGPQRQDRLSPRAARLPGLRRAGRQASRRRPSIVDSRKPFHDPASVYQVVHMMQGVTTRGTGGRSSRRSAGRSPARPARPTTRATTGSWARRPTSPSASMSASTSRARWARQHGDRQRQRRADLRAHRHARSSRASRRPRSASRPACAWSSGSTATTRSQPGTEPEGFKARSRPRRRFGRAPTGRPAA